MKSFKKKVLQINAFLHRWLGLLSGLVVFILGVTGCILTFQTEIEDVMEPYRRVSEPVEINRQPRQLLAPLQDSVGNVQFKALKYLGVGRSVVASYMDSVGRGYTAYLHPRDGSVLRINQNGVGFFAVMLHL